MLAQSKRMERTINQFRIERGVRVLWPDYEVYDLINEGINLEDLRFFTSNHIQIIKIRKEEGEMEEIFADKAFTHLAVHAVEEFDEETELKNVFFAIVSKRGIAVDELHCRFVRGNYLITVTIAQLNKQTNFWGVQSVADEIKIIDTKYIVKKKSIWVLQFQSSKSIKSLLFYSTKRQPHYGKSSSYDNELPKDAKLEFCMNVRNFSSVMDNLLDKKEETLIKDIHFLKKSHIHSISFSEESIKKQSLVASETESKGEESSVKKRTTTGLRPSDHKKVTKARFFPNSTCQQIFEVKESISITHITHQIQSFIDKNEQNLHDLGNNSQLPHSIKDILSNMSFKEIKQYTWKELTDLLQVAKQENQLQLHQYILSVLLYVFTEQNDKDIRNWLQLSQYAHQLQNEQKDLILQWLRKLLDLHCRQMLNQCEDYIFEMIPRQELTRIVTNSLERCSEDGAKVCDLLEILMRISNKSDILDLYSDHRLPDSPLIISSSLRAWQAQHNFFNKENSIFWYETNAQIPYLQYNPLSPTHLPQDSSPKPDFSFTFICQKVPKNAFITGQPFSFNNTSFRYFLLRKQDTLLIFLQQITPFASQPHTQKFTSFEISISATVCSQTRKSHFGWSFISPSPAIGTRLTFNQLSDSAPMQCKISLTRKTIHDSILNYLHVRFGELMNLPNRCSDRLQSENKKIAKRRSSAKLQKNLLKMPMSEGLQPSCFLHQECHKCQGLWFPLTHLSFLDLYSLFYAAPLKEETDALFPTIKYIIISPSPNRNLQFWTSQIRAKHLHLRELLITVKLHPFDAKRQEMLNSLIQEILKDNLSLDPRNVDSFRFIKSGQSRMGKSMWRRPQGEYSQELLEFSKNIHGKH